MRTVLALILATFVTSGPCHADDYLNWTSKRGTTIRAKFVSEQDGRVTLLRENGTQLVLRRDQLDEESQQQADALIKARKAESDPAAETPDPSTLAYKVQTFPEGPWKGYHAVYEREKFVALVEKRGHVRIYLKKDGELFPGGLPCRLRFTLHAKKNIVHTIRSIETAGKPSTAPKKLTFTGETVEGTKFQITYLFENDSLAAYGYLRDPGGLEHPTILRLGMRFPVHKVIKPGTSETEKRLIVGDSWIKAEAQDRSDLEFDYIAEVDLNKSKQVRKGLETVTVKPVTSGPNLFKFEAPDRKFGTLRLWNQSTKAPHTGFSVNVYRSDPSERSSRARILVEVE